ncbi:hypothetical protein ElyMa_003134600 [Elysia marginata]|uniref:Transmembrane protein n=1 Tax=Elysia marginata TaxID=1093978 RepID=A0AAV4IVD0_9GAST|nr:hypothetical protein ElyMa_003134600 [Elysia marginata]
MGAWLKKPHNISSLNEVITIQSIQWHVVIVVVVVVVVVSVVVVVVVVVMILINIIIIVTTILEGLYCRRSLS